MDSPVVYSFIIMMTNLTQEGTLFKALNACTTATTSTMNIPSPAITTTNTTPQDPTRAATTTTTVTLPSQSDAIPLLDFRSDTNEGDNTRSKERSTMATCVALGDLVSEVFELVNDQACGDLVDGKADNEKREKFLKYIGVDSYHRRVLPTETVETFDDHFDDKKKSTSSRTAAISNDRVIPKRNLAPFRKKKQAGGSGSDSDTLTTERRDSPTMDSAQSMTSRTTITSRASKYFGESPLARRRRAKNTVLEALRRSEKEEYLSDQSLYTSEEGESGSRDDSLYTTDEDDDDGDTATQKETFDTEDSKEVDSDGAVKHGQTDGKTRGGDDAPREDVDDTASMLEAAAEFRDASFPPIVQKFHSVNPVKPTKISKYNKQWPPPLQYPTEAEDFEAFIDQIKNHRSSSPYRLMPEEQVKQDQAAEETEDDDIVSTKIETQAVEQPEAHKDNTLKEGRDSPEEEETFIPSSTAHKLPKRSKPRKSFWRPTVVQQVDEATVPIPLTTDRLNQVEENKKRVQRNFQLRVKHHQAMIVRQRLNKRQQHSQRPQFVAAD